MELNDRNLRLRYHYRLGCCQVWYFPPNACPYIIFNIEDNYNLCWAIRKLKDRQRDGASAELLRQLDYDEGAFDRKNHELSREMAELLDDRRKGKIVTSV